MHQPRLVAVSVPVYLPDVSEASAADLDIPADLQALRVPLFLLCSSRKHADRWVLPKGGVEKGETSAEAAVREGWEEAGFRGTHLVSLSPSIAVARPSKPKHHADDVPRALYDFELCLVTRLEQDWPEKHERTRRWATRDEVERLTSWRNEVAAGLGRVSKNAAELASLARSKLSQSQ